MSSEAIRVSIALNRFGYGLKRGERAPTDPRRYLLRQFDAYDPRPEQLSDWQDTSDKAGEILTTIRRNRRQRQDAMKNQDADSASMESGQPAAMANETFLRGSQAVRRDIIIRSDMAINGKAPMIERLVHFWSNHFSVTAGKPGTHYQVGNHEFRTIRPHTLGKFGDMLKAAVLHSAMLIYLDQFRSVGPNSPWQTRRRQRSTGRERGLNENLAREILELHTLGVNGGYHQADVTELARALTGWTIRGIMARARAAEPQFSGADFLAEAHEPGTRTIMGQSYAQKGPDQALAILDDLATHPSTAKFVATKLARHFAGDTPPTSLIAKLESDFLRTGGDLASLSRTLVEAPEVWAPGPVKFRAPFEWFISVLRMTGVEGLRPNLIARGFRELGQMPWHAPSPAGYDDIAESWAGSDAVFRRVELAERLVRNVASDKVLKRAEAAFPGTLSDHTRTWLSRAESSKQALGLLLVAPEMMRR